MPNIGQQLDFGIAKESTRNTSQTTATTWFPIRDWEFNVINDAYDDDSSFGVIDKRYTNEIAQQKAAGKFETFLDPDFAIYWLYYFFGQSSITTSLGASTHTLTMNNTIQPPSFTTFLDKSDAGWLKTNGCAIKSLEIKAEAAGDASISAEIMGLQETVATTQTPTYTQATRLMKGLHFKIGFATSTAGLNAPTYVDARSFSLKMNRNSDWDTALGSTYPVDILSGAFEVEFEFSAVVKAATAVSIDSVLKTGQKLAWIIDGTNTQAGVIGTSALYPRISFKTAPSRTEHVFKGGGADELATFDIKVLVQYGTTEGYTIQGTVQNAIATL